MDSPGGRVVDQARRPDRVRLDAPVLDRAGPRGLVRGPDPGAARRGARLDPGRPTRARRLPDSLLVDADVSQQRIELRYGTKVLDRFPVTVGSPSSPTPLGDYAVTDGLVGPGAGSLVRLLRARALAAISPTCRRAGSAAIASRSTERPARIGGADLTRLPAGLRPGHDRPVRPGPARRAGLHPRLNRRLGFVLAFGLAARLRSCSPRASPRHRLLAERLAQRRGEVVQVRDRRRGRRRGRSRCGRRS